MTIDKKITLLRRQRVRNYPRLKRRYAKTTKRAQRARFRSTEDKARGFRRLDAPILDTDIQYQDLPESSASENLGKTQPESGVSLGHNLVISRLDCGTGLTIIEKRHFDLNLRHVAPCRASELPELCQLARALHSDSYNLEVKRESGVYLIHKFGNIWLYLQDEIIGQFSDDIKEGRRFPSAEIAEGFARRFLSYHKVSVSVREVLL